MGKNSLSKNDQAMSSVQEERYFSIIKKKIVSCHGHINYCLLKSSWLTEKYCMVTVGKYTQIQNFILLQILLPNLSQIVNVQNTVQY